MEKMRMETPDLTAVNVEKIGALFPNCITEMADENGKLKKAVNFDLLRQMLSGDVLEGDEAYEFTWVGKKAAIVEANKPIRKTLRPCLEESVDWDTTENLYIEGDNLEVLKLLQESYLGKIKMIYIDPPYNTGSDCFLYPDNYVMDKEVYEAELGIYDVEGNINFKENSNANPRFHSDWCSMIYSRLLISRNLLTEDGAILISIDDNEVANLIEICNEIYGAANFVGLFCRKTKAGGGSASGSCAVEHDYVLCFAKNTSLMPPLLEKFDDKYLERYKESDDIGPYFWDTMERSSTATRPYTIEAPDGTVLKGKWFRSEATFKRDLTTGEVRFLKKTDGSWSVQFKQRLADGKKLRTILENSDLTDKKYRSLSQELEAIVGCSLGHPPKPVSLLETLVYSVCTSSKTGDIILDFFAGSSSTAHSVMNLNAKDAGKRKFIMVQLPEVCKQGSDAEIAGYANVSDIGKERIRRAGKNLKKDNPLTTENLDIGFRVFKLDESNMNDVYYAAGDYTQDMLTMLESNVKPDRSDLDLLFGCLLEWGLPLSMPYKSEKIEGCTVHTYNDGDLVACFDENIPETVIKEIAHRQPLRAVFRDSSFNGSPAKINVGEIFKMLAPDTRIKVI